MVQREDELQTSEDPRLWLDQRVLRVLKSRTSVGQHPLARLRYSEPYYGKTASMWGYSFCFENLLASPQRFLMISRTHVASTELQARKAIPTHEQLVRELETEVTSIPKDKFGRYHEELRIPGTYATIYCCGKGGRYYFMVSESGRMMPYYGFKAAFPNLRGS